VVVVVVALVIVALVVRGFLTPAPAPIPTVRTSVVSRDTVRTVAAETGTVVPVQQQNVNFRQSGQLTAVNVKVGDHVKAGDVLAKIDDRPFQNALAQAQQRQQQDQATLNATITGNAVETAAHNVDSARTALANAQSQATLTNQQDAVTVAQDQSFLSRDATVLAKDQATLTADQNRLAHDRAVLDADTNQLQADQAVVARDQAVVAKDQGRVSVDQSKLQQDQAKANAACGTGGTTTTSTSTTTPSPPPPGTTTTTGSSTTTPNPPSAQCRSDQSKVQSDQDQLNSDEKQLANDQKVLALDQAPVAQDQAQIVADQSQISVDSPSLITDRQLVSQDATKVEQDQQVLRADLQKQAADQIAGKRAVDEAQAALTSAEDALTAQTNLRPNTIANEQAVVAADAAAVDTAHQNVEETTLTAPVDGTVANINGAPGEPVIVGQEQTARAPGSNAPLPDTSATNPFAPASLAAGGSPAVQAFLVLTDVHSFQVVATVAERDAARVSPGQQVQVTFDAIPGLSLPGSVLAVQPVATLIQDVTNFLVTVNLDQIDPRLKSGMTAHASVAVGEVKDVLAVPNIAIQHSGGHDQVVVVRPDGTQRKVEVKLGVVGDTTSEVIAGLREGDHVVLPAVTPPGALSSQPLG
jgi:multidrug efflux pump subunit AcrA (membrane-fusion protein)